MRQMVGTNRIAKRLSQRLLAYYTLKSGRAILSCRYDIIFHTIQLTRKGSKYFANMQILSQKT
jgi:hypothetical protein